MAEFFSTISIDAGLTLAVILLCFVTLTVTSWSADIVLLGAVFLLMFAGVIAPGQALQGFANEGLATVAILYIVATGLVRTGVVTWLSEMILGRPKGLHRAQLRLMFPVAALSSVLNNTPVVAMLVPGISSWAKRFHLSPSQLMMPLSYAAITGGLCTLVGTSTNLVLNGMMREVFPDKGLAMFELAFIGVPCVLVTVGFVLLASKYLLPNKIGAMARFEDAREYVIEFKVQPASFLIGKSIEQAGLRNLPGVFLIEIERNGSLLPAVSPVEVLQADDRLVFAGNVESVVDLQKINGLVPAEDQIFKLKSPRVDRCLVEAVISPQFPGLGQTVKEYDFRKRYGAVIIAVSRSGENVRGRIGDIELRPGDLLLIEAHNNFPRQMQYSRDFLLVSELENSRVPYHEKGLQAFLIMLGMIITVGFGWLSMFKAVVIAAGLMLVTRCISVHAARQSVDWQVVLVIGASIGLGTAVEVTGMATALAHLLVQYTGDSPASALTGLFILTALFSALISNMAAGVLMFPIAAASAATLGVDIVPFIVTLMVAASCCFATPIGYQTNLMVMAPGDYRFVDFLKMGLPLTVLIGITTIIVVPVIWPF